MKENTNERSTYIFACSKDVHCFVCNRNSDDFNTLFKDPCVKFWEVDELSQLDYKNVENVRIVKTLPYSNYNREDQKKINEVKREVCKELNADENELILCNATFIDGYRTYYRNMFVMFVNALNNIKDLNDKVYDYAKKMFYNTKNAAFYKLRNFEIWQKPWTDEMKVICILLKNYIYAVKYILRYKQPFNKDIFMWLRQKRFINKADMKKILKNKMYINVIIKLIIDNATKSSPKINYC